MKYPWISIPFLYTSKSPLVPAGGFQGQMFEEQDQYIQERSNAMAQVESTIVELGDMFTQLATMVQGLYFVAVQG